MSWQACGKCGFSKKLSKEPKEDFLILSNLQKIAPEIKVNGEPYFDESQLADLSLGRQVMPIDDTSGENKVKLFRAEVLYNNN